MGNWKLGYGILGVKKVGYGRLGVKKVGICEIGNKQIWDMGYWVPCVTLLNYIYNYYLITVCNKYQINVIANQYQSFSQCNP